MTSCGSPMMKPFPGKLDDNTYKRPQALSGKEEYPKEVPSPLGKQVKLVNSGNNGKKKQNGSSQAQVLASSAFATPSVFEPGQIIVDDDDDEVWDPVHREAAIVIVSTDNQHPSITSYNPFDSNGRLTIDLNKEAEQFVYPINGRYSSGYGTRGRGWHSGIDLVAPLGDPIYAAFDGRVRISKPYGGYGNMVVIQHANGLETLYGHCSEILVQEGQMVMAGDQIALCGRTGRATANHLHFEVRIAGLTINPSLLVDYSTQSIQSGILNVSKSGSRITASRSNGDQKINNIEKPSQPTKQEAILAANVSASSNGTSRSFSSVPRAGNGSSVASTTVKSFHTISQGDTLYGLALRYGTTVDKICILNEISETIILKIGAKLRIK